MAWTHENAEVLTAVIFTLVSLTHLVRAASGWDMQVGPYPVPMWLSWLAVVLIGYLAIHFWRKILAR